MVPVSLLANVAPLGTLNSRTPGEQRTRVSPTIASAVAFLEQHYLEPVTCRDVARTVCRHKGYLAARFRLETGVTMRDYMTVLRIRHASELVAAGEKIESVMLSVGYHSKRTFYTRFRTVFGVTPGEYRRTRQ
jgi:transcriptional regulator GlxA family with amidase domain